MPFAAICGKMLMCELNTTNFYFREFKPTIKHRGTNPIPVIVGTKQTRMLCDYNVPNQQNLWTIIIPVVVSSEYTHGVEYPSCSKVVRPYRQHQLQLSTEVCMHCGKHFTNAIRYFQLQDSIHYSI